MGIGGVKPAHQRMAELRAKQKLHGLTSEEQKELDICLDWNVKYCWTVAMLYNQSLIASMTDDVDWQHHICAELDAL